MLPPFRLIVPSDELGSLFFVQASSGRLSSSFVAVPPFAHMTEASYVLKASEPNIAKMEQDDAKE